MPKTKPVVPTKPKAKKEKQPTFDSMFPKPAKAKPAKYARPPTETLFFQPKRKVKASQPVESEGSDEETPNKTSLVTKYNNEEEETNEVIEKQTQQQPEPLQQVEEIQQPSPFQQIEEIQQPEPPQQVEPYQSHYWHRQPRQKMEPYMALFY